MKLKKLISAFAAFAMSVTMLSAFTVADAASLGGKPNVKFEFDGYEKVSETVAFAYLNITLDMTAAEALEEYSNTLDEITWEEVIKGNGITTFGISWSVPAGFTYTAAKSTVPAGLTAKAAAIAFGPKTTPEEYWTTPVTTIRLAYRVNNFDASGDITLPGNALSVDGKNSEENAVWSYATAAGTAEATAESIPSYNEWSTPEPSVSWTNVAAGTDYTGEYDGSKAAAYTVELAGDGTTYNAITWKATKDGVTKGHVTALSPDLGGEGSFKFGIAIGGVATSELSDVKAAWGDQTPSSVE